MPAHAIPMLPHDVSLDLVVTQSRAIARKRIYERPSGVLRDVLDAEKQDAIPVLEHAP